MLKKRCLQRFEYAAKILQKEYYNVKEFENLFCRFGYHCINPQTVVFIMNRQVHNVEYGLR